MAAAVAETAAAQSMSQTGEAAEVASWYGIVWLEESDSIQELSGEGKHSGALAAVAAHRCRR